MSTPIASSMFLGYAVAHREGGTPVMDYCGPLADTVEDAAELCTEDGDFVVIVHEVLDGKS